MKDDHVLVEVWIPAAFLKKDMILPVDMPVYLLLRLLDKLLQNMDIDDYKIQSDTRLYRTYPFEEFSLDAVLRDYQVMNAETFILL